ncbi:MAG: ferritin family protein [Bacteroidota bacterium]
MSTISENHTLENVARLYLLKLQAINQYEYFAKQSKKDGYEQIMAIFTEMHEQILNHAKTLFRLLEGQSPVVSLEVKSPGISNTAENLAVSIANEKAMIALLKECEALAWTEDQKKVATKLKLFSQISEFYVRRFEKLLKNIEDGTVFKKDHKVKWYCRKCGLIYESERALHNCPGCEHPQGYFEVLAENF